MHSAAPVFDLGRRSQDSATNVQTVRKHLNIVKRAMAAEVLDTLQGLLIIDGVPTLLRRVLGHTLGQLPGNNFCFDRLRSTLGYVFALPPRPRSNSTCALGETTR